LENQKVAIVTGAASGIGKAVAERLAARGYRLILTDINESGLSATAQGWSGDQVLTRLHDVRDTTAWQEIIGLAIERWGRLDLMLNIAGYLRSGETGQTDAAEIDRHLDINAKGVIYGTHFAAIQMRKQRAGHIVNIASLAGITPVPNLTLYSASKFAVRGYSLAAVQELRPHGIAVTVVCPDVIETPMIRDEKRRESGAILFSGPKPLDVNVIADIICGKVLDKKPAEVIYPGWRGGLAHLASISPWIWSKLYPIFMKVGKNQQKKKYG
jgi:3-oxoacyl-[acyl-carrier protein] reductase